MDTQVVERSALVHVSCKLCAEQQFFKVKATFRRLPQGGTHFTMLASPEVAAWYNAHFSPYALGFFT